MTIAELICELRSSKDHFEWEMDGSHNWIRGFVKGSRDLQISFDPLIAVCFIKTGKFFDEADWTNAGDAIGLSSADCIDILEAASNRRVDDIYNEWLRRQLLIAVGLESVPIPPAALDKIFSLVLARI